MRSIRAVVGAWRRAVAVAALILAPFAGAAAAEPTVTLALEGDPATVFRWSSDACEGWDIPDTAARAIRSADGTVRLYASHHANRAMSGPSLDAVRHDCAVVFQGAGSDKPSAFDDKAWLSGLYTLNGVDVFALVHNEFQGNLRPELCPSRQYMRCWRNSITFAASHDGGRSFAAPDHPRNLVATPPRQYEPDFGRHVGYFNPTNIIEREGFYYAFFSAAAYGAQKYGACVMRTDRLDDPSSWRAWDGAAFTIRFINPYHESDGDEASHVCEPVGSGRLITPLASIVRHEASGFYLMMMAGTRKLGSQQHPVQGFYVASSKDLISCSEPELVWATSVHPVAGSCASLTNYPSLIDPTSTSRNFESIGDRPYLYFVEQIQHGCQVGQERNLLRRPVRIVVKTRR